MSHFKRFTSTVGLGINQTAPTNDLLASDAALSNNGRFCYAFDLNTVTLEPGNITVFRVQPIINDYKSHLVYLAPISLLEDTQIL